LYTSGTTAFPKGVSLSLRAIMANAQGIAQWQHLSHTDRFGIVLPLHHINSTTMSFATLLVGGTIVLYSRYSASQFWQIASQHKVTVTSIVPTILHDLLVRKEEYEPQKHKLAFKRILIGSAPVLPEETLTFMETLDIDVVQGYGQTETALRVTGVPTTLSRKQYKELVKKNSIGKELAYCNVTVLRENGSRAKEKEEGELCVRGPVLADGYWNNAEATEKAFTKEWFHTEDMGYYEQIGGEKYFFMKGRMKEIIIKGGVNISPAAIEDALLKNFPEIQEVCVVGYEDSRMGEEIAAVVRLHGNSPAGGEFAKQVVRFGGEGKLKGLSRYEAPAQVFVTRDELPKTSTGKIQRVQVKAQVAKLIAKKAASHVYCRRVEAYEKVILQKMMELNNKRWSVPATYKEFMQRAQHGYVFGAFDDHENVVGTLSAVRVSRHELETATTWNGITANGTFKNNNEQGEVLVCAAITVDTFSEEQASIAKVPQLLADAVAKDYLKSGLDNVLRFHAKTKGGMKRGASVGRIIPRGRPDDTEAMGYNVVMEYPSIAKVKKIVKSKQASPAVMLIEKAMQVAKEQGCVQVVAFSRPAQFRAHIAKALHNSVPFEVRDVKAFALFAKKVQAAAKK
jgi:hypothetical protein